MTKLVGRLTGQKTMWARSAAGPILELKMKINNMKTLGLPGVLGLKQFGLRRRMKNKFSNFLQGFYLFLFKSKSF
jgi:hypothetical protein